MISSARKDSFIWKALLQTDNGNGHRNGVLWPLPIIGRLYSNIPARVKIHLWGFREFWSGAGIFVKLAHNRIA